MIAIPIFNQLNSINKSRQAALTWPRQGRWFKKLIYYYLHTEQIHTQIPRILMYLLVHEIFRGSHGLNIYHREEAGFPIRERERERDLKTGRKEKKNPETLRERIENEHVLGVAAKLETCRQKLLIKNLNFLQTHSC